MHGGQADEVTGLPLPGNGCDTCRERQQASKAIRLLSTCFAPPAIHFKGFGLTYMYMPLLCCPNSDLCLSLQSQNAYRASILNLVS